MEFLYPRIDIFLKELNSNLDTFKISHFNLKISDR